MPKSTLALKATVTKRDPAAVNPDLKARLAELQHHQAAEAAEAAAVTADPFNRAVIRPETGNPPAPATAPAQNREPSGKQLKREAHALQSAFLAANLNRVVTVFTLNGVKLVGKLRQFDQFCLLLEGPDGANSLIFKHAVSTLTPASR